MHPTRYITIILFVLVVFFSISVFGHRNGARVETCARPRSNQPCHGKAQSQPLSTSPYKILASSSQYKPNSQITVSIGAHSFRGFFLQARDSNTDKLIGSWSKTTNTTTYPECSAVSHADPRKKKQADFIWNAPTNASGSVYFTGTVLKKYNTYWSGLESDVLSHVT